MVRVIANTKGYFGGVVINAGEGFECPDELWNDPAKRPRWAGADQGVAAIQSQPISGIQIPSDWQDMSAAERRTLAKLISGEDQKNVSDADRLIEAYLEVNKPALFADAPEPEVIKGNGVKEALGVAPDWMPPAADDGKPVQAED